MDLTFETGFAAVNNEPQVKINIRLCSLIGLATTGVLQDGCLLECSVQSGITRTMMEAVSTSKTSLNFYQTTRRSIPEDSHLHTRRCKNLKSHQQVCFCNTRKPRPCGTRRSKGRIWSTQCAVLLLLLAMNSVLSCSRPVFHLAKA
jgi:hypothetical protein